MTLVPCSVTPHDMRARVGAYLCQGVSLPTGYLTRSKRHASNLARNLLGRAQVSATNGPQPWHGV